MRWLFLLLVGAAGFVNGLAYGQSQPSEDELLAKFREQGVFLQPIDPSKKEMMASVRVSNAETLIALDALSKVKDLTEIRLGVVEAIWTEPCLKRIKSFPGVKQLEIRADEMTVADFKTIVTLKQLERLTLECADLSDAQLRQLHAMKDLKELRLICLQVSPKTLDELKRALPQAISIEVERMLLLFALPPVKISSTEDGLTKLQREKFNAALAEIRIFVGRLKAGQLNLAGNDSEGPRVFLESGQRLVAAALDLNDPPFAMKVVDGHVQLLAQIYKETESQHQAGQVHPQTFYRVQYQYLDAQILQIRLKKKLEGK
jgi:hypothetical protein